MAENSSISWTTHTFNPWEGCQETGSIACVGCYARERNLRYAPKGTTEAPNWGPGKPRRRTVPSNWAKLRKWNREAAATRRAWFAPEGEPHGGLGGAGPPPTYVFVASLADVMDNAVPLQWLADLLVECQETSALRYLFLTKRPQLYVKRITAALALAGLAEMPRNIALGCTVVTQEEADRDVPWLLAAKATLRPLFAFLSMEPLAGAVELRNLPIGPHHRALGFHPGDTRFDALHPANDNRVDWVIVGGATDQGKHKAFHSDPAWFRSLRDQCAAAGVPFHFKQWGEWVAVSEVPVSPSWKAELRLTPGGSVVRVGSDHDPCTLDGVRHDAMPEAA